MENARLLVLDVIGGKGLYEANIGEKLEDFYEHLKCDCFDIAHRKIGGKWFDIFCDEEGLFKDNPITSAVVKTGTLTANRALVGNLIFANHDAEGNTTSLSDTDVDLIKHSIVTVYNPKERRSLQVVEIDIV